MGTVRVLALAMASAFAIAACGERPGELTRAFDGPGVSVAIAPLALPGVGDAVWDLEVVNGGSEVVWQRRITSSGYGDGAGAASYLGPCDADPAVSDNTVRLWLVGVYAGPVADPGSFASGAATGAGAVDGVALAIASPTAAGALARSAACRPDADVAVRFDVTVSRAAQQGFFDIAVSFNDLFCSAKYDCCADGGDGVCAGDGSEDIALLFDASGARARTHVLGFACTAGAAADVVTRLYLDDLALDCTDPYGPAFSADLLVHPGAAAAGNLCTAGDVGACDAVTPVTVDPDLYLYQVAVYRGVEQLESGGGSAQKVYWNVALGVNDVSACRLVARGTADDEADAADGLADGVIAAGAVYPYVQWDVNLDTCASEALTFGAAGSVTPGYTQPTGPTVTFSAYYDAVDGIGGYCAPECQNSGTCVAGVCQCPPGYSGPTCETVDSPLALSPLTPVVGYDGTVTFAATGGAGGYVFSVQAGGGSVGAASGVYTAPSADDSAVVRVTDLAGRFVETTVSTCPNATIATNTTLPPGAYCYGSLTVNGGVTLTLDGTGATGAGVTIRAGTMDVAGTVSANARGYSSGLGPGAGSGSANTATNEASSGGGHGGAGGAASCGPAGGAANDDPLAPVFAGSGGDSSETLAGGRGGGVIRLAVTGTLSLAGAIQANGAGGQSNGNKASGGGAGGGVWITAGTLAGSGAVAARGGAGVMSGYGCWSGGGGGGRIAVYADHNTSTVTYDVAGGGGNSPGATGSIAFAYDGVLTLWNIAHTFTSDTAWHGLIVSSNASATVAVGATLTLDGASLAGPLTNYGTLSLADGLTLYGGGSYGHGADATLEADTAALAVTAGSNNFNVSTGALEAPVFASLSVASGATLSHSANGTNYARRLWLDVLGDVTVDGAIDVSARGYSASQGPGAGASNGTVNQAAPGAGFGGAGGSTPNCVAISGGAAYGDPMEPENIGSGGGSSGSYSGGAGGGEVRLTVGGTLTVNGAIRANGGNGGYNANYASGGGSGGTVWIDAATLSGAGTLSAHGGSGYQSGYGCYSGAGGGGRVAVTAQSSSFTGSYDLATGGGPAPGGAGTRRLAYAGALDIWNFGLGVTTPLAWTVLTVHSNASLTLSGAGEAAVDTLNLYGTLTNGGLLSVATTILLSGGRYHHVVGGSLDADTAALSVPPGTGIWDVNPAVAPYPRVGSATVAAGATLTHSANGTTHQYSMLLETVTDLVLAGSLNVSSKGYTQAAGPGAGTSNTTANKATSGGGHGGVGGPSTNCTIYAGGGTYGSSALPVTPGSGGGNAGGSYYGGKGGGVVGLDVGGTLTLSGTIVANGAANVTNNNYASGGGAGGSVWLGVDTLSGGGSVTARGGNAARSGYGCYSGAGGGGRIAIYYTTNGSTVTANAAGGTGGTGGANGSNGTLVY